MEIGRLQPLQLLFICAKIHFGIRRICENVWRCNDTCNDIFWSPHVCEWGSVNCDTRPTAVTLRFLFHLSWTIWENPYITFGSSSSQKKEYCIECDTVTDRLHWKIQHSWKNFNWVIIRPSHHYLTYIVVADPTECFVHFYILCCWCLTSKYIQLTSFLSSRKQNLKEELLTINMPIQAHQIYSISRTLYLYMVFDSWTE